MNLPFKMRQETEMEKWRYETFWEKEPECLGWIRSFFPRDIFFDVGANIGVYSLYAASLFPEMSISAFEPMSANYQVLLENKRLNAFWNIITFPWAMGSEIKMVCFDSGKRTAGESGGQVAEQGEEILLVTIDVCGSQPDHVKIDIDGQELQVVLGMRRTLPHIKSALIEVSSRTKADIVGIMMAAGFTTDNRFNKISPHSSDRRRKEGIDAENIIFTR